MDMLLMYHIQKKEDKVSLSLDSAKEKVLEPKIERVLSRVDSLCSSKAVSLPRVWHESKFFAQIYELANELDRILHVNIVVHCSVSEKKNTLEIFCMSQYRAELIAFFIVARPVHVTLSIYCVIEFPGSGWIARIPMCEIICPVCQRQACDVSAIASSGDADSLMINKRFLTKPSLFLNITLLV